jgi:hypothetical protein
VQEKKKRVVKPSEKFAKIFKFDWDAIVRGGQRGAALRTGGVQSNIIARACAGGHDGYAEPVVRLAPQLPAAVWEGLHRGCVTTR